MTITRRFLYSLAVLIIGIASTVYTRNMSSLASAKAANKAHNFKSPVSVFVGGTAGIGAALAIKLASYSQTPEIHIVGRNQKAAEGVLSELKQANSQGKYVFHQCDITSIANLRTLTSTLRTSTPKINHLVLSAGIMTTRGRTETKEGNDIKLMLHYYSRAMIVHELLPNVESAANAGEDARVMSVLASQGGNPNKLNWDDLDLKKTYSLQAAADHAVTMTDIAYERWARIRPNIGFTHAYPGLVQTSLFKELPWYLSIPSNIATKIGGVKPSDCADWMLYGLTRKETAKGIHYLDNHGDMFAKDKSTVAQQDKVWEHTESLLGKV